MAAVLAVVTAESAMSTADLAWCLLGGIAGGIGVTALYRGLAEGRMAVMAPLTAVIAASIPVTVGILTEGVPPALVVAGMIIAFIAVILVSSVDVSSVDDRSAGLYGLRFALIAGIGIGTFGVCLAQVSHGHIFGPLVLMRAIQVVLIAAVALATRAAWRPARKLVPAIVAVGVLDLAGNGAYFFAIQAGSLAIATVVSSLYPVTTVILATVLLHERVSRAHAVGIALAVVALVAIAAGATG